MIWPARRKVQAMAALGAATIVLCVLMAEPAYAHDPAVGRRPATSSAGAARVLADRRLREHLVLATVSITGTVLNFDGTPAASDPDNQVAVVWYALGQGADVGAVTDAAGVFAFDNVPATTGVLRVMLPDGTQLFYNGQDFATGSPFTLRPGKVSVVIAHPFDPTFNSVQLASGSLTNAVSVLEGASGSVLATPGLVNHAWINTAYSAAVEWKGAATVAAGAESSTTVAVDARHSLSVATTGWASGKPGSRVGYRLRNWPIGYRPGIVGFSEYHDAAFHDFGLWTSTGPSVTRTFTIPTTAPAGYPYEIHASLKSGADVWDAFQVCTLRASAATINYGQSITLSGIIPTSMAARMGMHPGPAKTLLVFGRITAASAQPTTWLAPGWTNMGRVNATTSGAYKITRSPKRTTWYVVRYPGDSWNWRAFTSVIKVTVR